MTATAGAYDMWKLATPPWYDEESDAPRCDYCLAAACVCDDLYERARDKEDEREHWALIVSEAGDVEYGP